MKTFSLSLILLVLLTMGLFAESSSSTSSPGEQQAFVPLTYQGNEGIWMRLEVARWVFTRLAYADALEEAQEDVEAEVDYLSFDLNRCEDHLETNQTIKTIALTLDVILFATTLAGIWIW